MNNLKKEFLSAYIINSKSFERDLGINMREFFSTNIEPNSYHRFSLDFRDYFYEGIEDDEFDFRRLTLAKQVIVYLKSFGFNKFDMVLIYFEE